jgi:hypothetical protein
MNLPPPTTIGEVYEGHNRMVTVACSDCKKLRWTPLNSPTITCITCHRKKQKAWTIKGGKKYFQVL